MAMMKTEMEILRPTFVPRFWIRWSWLRWKLPKAFRRRLKARGPPRWEVEYITLYGPVLLLLPAEFSEKYAGEMAGHVMIKAGYEPEYTELVKMELKQKPIRKSLKASTDEQWQKMKDQFNAERRGNR